MVPLTTALAFSTLLTWIFILYQPTEGPGALQRLGWQAWDSVSNPATQSNTGTGAGSASENIPPEEQHDSSEPVHEGVDWWNVTTEDKEPDPGSLPLDVWNPLLPHDTGCM